MKTLGSPASVLAAMREDGAAEVERIEHETLVETARLAESGQAEIVAPDREEKLAAASREARERIAREDWDDARAALEARERWMQRAAEEGRKLLTTDRETLKLLASEALQRLPKGPCTLHVSRSTPVDDALLRELGLERGEPVEISGGCIVRSTQSALSVDNSFEERARRFQVQLRAALGKAYGS